MRTNVIVHQELTECTIVYVMRDVDTTASHYGPVFLKRNRRCGTDAQLLPSLKADRLSTTGSFEGSTQQHLSLPDSSCLQTNGPPTLYFDVMALFGMIAACSGAVSQDRQMAFGTVLCISGRGPGLIRQCTTIKRHLTLAHCSNPFSEPNYSPHNSNRMPPQLGMLQWRREDVACCK